MKVFGQRTRRIAIGAGIAGLCIAGGAALGGGPGTAFADDTEARHREGRPELTDEQKACLEENGITGRPDGVPTAEMREAFKEAAETCGIELPGPMHRRGHHRGDRPELTDEQKACMAEAGISERPERPLSEDERAEFKSAADACGIELRASGPGAHCTPPPLEKESLAS